MISKIYRSRALVGAPSAGVVFSLVVACSTNSGTGSDGGSAPSCSPAGGEVAGPADMHCVGQPAQVVNPSECDAAAGDDGGGGGGDDGGGGADAEIGNCGNSAFGATNYGHSSVDDDCKYAVSWTSTPVCEGVPVYFTVTVKYASNGAPVTGANAQPDWVLNCNHLGPSNPAPATQSPEDPPGTYKVGPIVFDKPGKWVFRFHFNETCTDLPDSPHGHAAYYINVP
jgi:hypothetical protein